MNDTSPKKGKFKVKRRKKVSQKEKKMLDTWDRSGYGSIERRGKANVHGFRK